MFAGYLEDLIYTPKTLKALASLHAGAIVAYCADGDETTQETVGPEAR